MNDCGEILRSDNAFLPTADPLFTVTSELELGTFGFTPEGPNPNGLLGQVWIEKDSTGLTSLEMLYLLVTSVRSSKQDSNTYFYRSTDGGYTWSDPIRVNDDPQDNGAWQWFGTMDVAPSGRIDAVWNDTRNDPNMEYSALYYAYSIDGGVTWSQNIPVSPPFNHFLGYPGGNDKLGDYYTMISDNTGAHVAYAATFNGEQDIYYLRIPAIDCNLNGVPDETDLTNGTSADCNADGFPDECDPGDDCNANGIPDECDIAAGASADCNANALPDECESRYFAASEDLGPLDAAAPVGFTIPRPPLAAADVTVTVTARGDLDASNEYVDIELNGRFMYSVFRSNGQACPVTPQSQVFMLSAETFNDLVAGCNAYIEFVPSAAVSGSECTDSFMQMSLDYATLDTAADCNENAVIDTCEPGDYNGDGRIDLADHAALPACLTGPGGGPLVDCCALLDFDADAAVDLADFAALQSAFTGG